MFHVGLFINFKHREVMKLFLYFSLLLLSLFSFQVTNSAEFVQLDEKKLLSVKTSLKNKTSSETSLNAYQDLIRKADVLLDLEVFSVTHKEILAPTNNPNDYLSISRYWWPDETKEEGLPWVRRDGETNPDTQTDKVDRQRLGEMTKAVRDLSYAYYFSDDEKYAKKGTELIRAWFLNDETKMNPHLTYAQSVPGIDKRRRSGILDGRLIPLWVLDSIALYEKSEHWSEQDNEQMNQWLGEYLTWLTESKLGKSGAKQTNNHGSWYRFQVIALAWYLQKNDVLESQLGIAKVAMAEQFNDEGAQEHELTRTKSFFYSCFNLDAITRTAIIAEKANNSMWSYPLKETSELAKAIEFLLPVAQGEEWPYPTKGINLTDLVSVMVRYTQQTGSQEHQDLLQTLLLGVQEKAIGENREARLLNSFALFEPDLLE